MLAGGGMLHTRSRRPEIPAGINKQLNTISSAETSLAKIAAALTCKQVAATVCNDIKTRRVQLTCLAAERN